ncbi:hypothetical protein GCM10007096_34160 [Pullulanibacillus pueri]|uniref:HAMP domain-containing protein n=2 Tax=Pullulanibacillus pueri TaxID=1437324 RepID=A0A8J2ZYF0_9BACL|nr:hypothetical protein GCM10007096_34160 [Pullulanibacillus pueri]
MTARRKMFSYLYIRNITYIICSVLVVTIPFLIMLYHYSRNEIIKQDNEAIRLINDRLDEFFQSIQLTEDTVATDSNFIVPLTLHYALPDYDSAKTEVAFRNVKKTISNLTLFQEGIQFCVIGRDGHLPINSTNQMINNSFVPKEANWYQKVLSNTKISHIIFNNQRDYYLSSSNAISIIRAITDNTDKPIAFIIMDVTYPTIRNIIAKSEPKIPIKIYDRTNTLLYTNIKNPTKDVQDSAILNRQTSQETGITITSYTRNHFFSGGIGQIVIISLITLLFYLICIFIISLLSTRRFTRPIFSLMKNMKEVNEGNLNVTAKYKGNIVELNDLFHSFNMLGQGLRHMIKVNYETNLLKTRAELNALYQKTDPHFLYNVLETISSQAIIDGSESASVMCQKLGAMLAYNLHGQDIVSLNSEIEHTKDYVFITKNCVSFHNIHINYDLDAVTLKQLIPKMTIQPILENCFKHAFDLDPVIPPQILISSKKADEFVIIKISDNGKGMYSNQLNGLNNRLKQMVNNLSFVSKDRIGIGLRQVHARLNDYYGSLYSIKIHSTLGKGTTVVLTVPKKVEEDETSCIK